jgi:UDPglucose 6-dehydrogenase
MKITVFGVGYVGLIQGAVLAEVGHEVLCVDIDEYRISLLQQNRVPIFEPGLSEVVKKNQSSNRLTFGTDALAGVAHGQIIFIAVCTPSGEDGSADLQHVLEVARQIGRHMTEPKIVVNKSTVPVGAGDQVKAVVAEELEARKAELAFEVVSNPEFLKEGNALADCLKPDRIVIGTENPEAAERMRELYGPFTLNHDCLIFMDVRSAELTKYAANGMLAAKISFMNEIANIAELLGADVDKVRRGIGSDSRIGYKYIYPGCGYGGSCFPKDVRALIRMAEGEDYEPQLVKAVEEVNNRQKNKLFGLLRNLFDDGLAGRVFALWGLSFKPNTDDMREATSRVLMEALWAAGAKVQAFDPEAMKEAQRIYGLRTELTLMGTKEAALKGADALIICTDWNDFRAPDFDLIKSTLKRPIILDGRNLFDPDKMARKGLAYYGIGRGASVNRRVG